MAKRANKPILIQDTREKLPWDFKNDSKFAGVEVTKLDYGDYSIKGLEKIISIERKRDGNELLNNFGSNKDRIIREFERMQECMMRYIVIEQTLEQILASQNYYAMRRNPKLSYGPIVVINALHEAAMMYNIHVIFAGAKAQAMAKGILLKAYDLHKKGLLHAQRSPIKEVSG